jgi:glycosyltransferase involved in cell wall biosynthesis
MRIAIIIENVNRLGGQERVVAELAERLSRYHEVHLYCFSADDLHGERLTVHLIWRPFRSTTFLAVWILFASVFCLRDPRFDAVISQGGNSLKQTFVLLHNAHGLRMHGVRTIEWNYHPPSLARRVFQWLRSRFFLHYEGRAVRRCRGRVLAVSDFLKDYCLRQHHLTPDEVHVTPNGVDHAAFHPGLAARHREAVRTELGIPQDAFVALYLGGLWFEKGVPFLVEALSRMEDRGAHLVIVGYGDAGFFARLAARYKVADRVHIIPSTREPERFYGMADCLGFLSLVDAFGLVLAEAAASGLALVATNVGAAQYLVEDGASGFIVTQDAQLIAERLDTLAADRDLLARLRQGAYEKSLQLSWDKQAAQVMAILEEEASDHTI